MDKQRVARELVRLAEGLMEGTPVVARMKRIHDAEQIEKGDRLESSREAIVQIVALANKLIVVTEGGQNIFLTPLQRLMDKGKIKVWRL